MIIQDIHDGLMVQTSGDRSLDAVAWHVEGRGTSLIRNSAPLGPYSRRVSIATADRQKTIPHRTALIPLLLLYYSQG